MSQPNTDVIQGTLDMLILKTDKHEVQLPLSSFTANQGKLLFGMTAEQLNAAADGDAALLGQAADAVRAEQAGHWAATRGQRLLY